MFVISGNFIKKIYMSADGFYHIYAFQPVDRIETRVILKSFNTPTLIDKYILTGQWHQSKTHGPRFIISHLERFRENRERGQEYIKHIKNMVA